jgi:predicted phosphodiesterase
MKIALISDIHEDVMNLTKALRLIEKAGCETIACLGDIVGFSTPFYKYHDTRDANECIRLISENVKYVVAGNHDHYAIRKLPEHLPGFALPENWYDLPFDQRKTIAGGMIWLYEDNELSALLSDASRDWLAHLPEQLVITEGGYNILLTHFLAPDITGFTTKFLFSAADFEGHLAMMNTLNANLALFGHAHRGRLFIISLASGKEPPKLFKKTKINHLLKGAGIPAIARSDGFSGFAVLDTTKNTIDAITLGSGFKIFQHI